FRTIEEFEATTAAAPGQEREEQVVNLADFDGTDSFTLGCSGCAAPTTVFTNGGVNYNAAALATEIQHITGQAATVTGYEGGAPPGAAGFTVDWASFADIPTLTVTPVSGVFDWFTGTIVNGGT